MSLYLLAILKWMFHSSRRLMGDFCATARSISLARNIEDMNDDVVYAIEQFINGSLTVLHVSIWYNTEHG